MLLVVCELPQPLLDRLNASGDLVAGVVDVIAGAISDQYVRDARAFDDAEGDVPWTFAVNLHAHSWARIVERVQEGPGVQLVEQGLAHAVRVGGLTIRPYKLGSDAPPDIRLVRLDPSSATKAMIAQANDRLMRGQLTLDLADALPTPNAMDTLAYAADQLVMAHFGNPTQGRQAIYIGAPRPELTNGSYWGWVIKLAGPGPDLHADTATPADQTGPTTAFSERQEPAVELGRVGERRPARAA